MASRSGEFERIGSFFKRLSSGFEGAFDLSDDAALLTHAPDEELVVSVDAIVEGVHCLVGEPPDRLARKALRVNLSDLAAMGARPLAYMLTLALPDRIADDWIASFAAGLGRDQERFGVALIGGDSVSTRGPILVSITAFGTVAQGALLRRDGAKPGDRIYVSGALGDAALGLRVARGELTDLSPRVAKVLADRYHEPEPRLALGQALAGVATAGLDVSDGLVGDLAHICKASGLRAVIDSAAVPLSAAAETAIRGRPALYTAALAGGDDYELLFTAPEGATSDLDAVSRRLGISLTPIGTMMAAENDLAACVEVFDAHGQPIDGLRGWTHS